MGSNTRWLALLVLVLALVLLVGTVSAGSVTDPTTGITLVHPDSREECGATTDTITVNGLSPNHVATIVVTAEVSGSFLPVARFAALSPNEAGSVTVTFNYPDWSDSISLFAQVEVYDASTSPWGQVVMLRGNKWTITCPPPAAACTPGYWRNHYDAWTPTGYGPEDDFDTIFGVDYFDPDITLAEAVWLGGGGVNKVARFGVAALLTAGHPDVGFSPYGHPTVAEVIALVQAGDGDTLGNLFADGEYECPLN